MAKKNIATLSKTNRWPVLLLGSILVFAGLVVMLPIVTDNAWGHGFAHPLEGWDHIITMIAVGIWAAQLRGHAVWLLPLSFVGVMSLGGIAGTAGILIPVAEGVILLSCAVFSLFIIRRIKFSNPVNLSIVSFFAFFHGFAHGQEISASASLLSYSLGFMLATLLLHGAGILITKLILLCLTFFLAILLPNLAQAAQAKQINNTNGSFKHFAQQVKFGNGLSPGRQNTKHFYTDSERIAIDDCNIKFIGLCSEIPDKPDAERFVVKQRTPLTNQAGIIKIQRFDYGSGMSPFINHLKFVAPVIMPQHLTLILRPDNSLTIAAAFKHYFPDINFTPGLVLLSNGVGITSPPLKLITSNTSRITRFYRFLFNSLEDRALHIIHSAIPDASTLKGTVELSAQPDSLLSVPRLNGIVGLFNYAAPNARSAANTDSPVLEALVSLQNVPRTPMGDPLNNVSGTHPGGMACPVLFESGVSAGYKSASLGTTRQLAQKTINLLHHNLPILNDVLY
jgi:urease accessory protein